MIYHLDPEKLYKCLSDITDMEERNNYLFKQVCNLCSGIETDWAKKPPKPKSVKAIGPYTDDFKLFWEVYPKSRRTCKGGAFTEWKKIVKHEPAVLIDILKALDWQKLTPEWMDSKGKYIPNPETYLIKRRWEDEPPEVVTKNSSELYQDMNGLWREKGS